MHSSERRRLQALLPLEIGWQHEIETMNFVRSLWREGSPILRHGIVTGSIALVAAGLLRLSAMILPPDYFDAFHRIDHLLFVVLSWMFGCYTVFFLLVLLAKSIYYSALKGDQSQLSFTSLRLSPGDPSVFRPSEQQLNEPGESIVQEKIPLPREKTRS